MIQCFLLSSEFSVLLSSEKVASSILSTCVDICRFRLHVTNRAVIKTEPRTVAAVDVHEESRVILL